MENPESTNKIIVQEDIVLKPPGLGIRHLQCLLLFLAITVGFMMRTNLSIAIVAMTDDSSNPYFEQFDWSESTRGLVLSSLFWGYAASPIPAGLLAQRYGAVILLLIANLATGILAILSPVLSSLGWEYLCVARLLQGIFQGFCYPCIHTVLAKWVPPTERAILCGFTYGGSIVGSTIMLAISGVIVVSSLGWPGVFYISGGLAFIWGGFFWWFARDSPAEYKTISNSEREFIESMLNNSTKQKLSTPWRQIMTSKSFWAILVANGVQNWGFWTLLTQIPSYMSNILNFDINSNGLFSALPYLNMAILAFVLSYLSHLLISRKYISVVAGRKIFNTIGQCIPAVCLVALCYITEAYRVWAIVLLTIAVGANSGIQVGFLINHMDLAPNFAGTLIGFTHCFGNCLALCASLFAGFVLTDLTDPVLWRIVLFVAAGLYFVGNLVFLIFGKANLQIWNDVGDKTTKIETVPDLATSDGKKAKQMA